jgi:hypothetical protein
MKGIRDKVNILYTTPLSGNHKPKATAMLGETIKKEKY